MHTRTEPAPIDPRAPSATITIGTLQGIEPLGDQFGAAAPLTVPAPLRDLFFGQPAPNAADLAAADDDPAAVPAMNTYAILDAAKVTNLGALVETSGLPHRCLFRGDAYEDLKDVAPWIVQLEHGDNFTRNLFTRGDAPWHLWDHEAGIFLRSRASLEACWSHMRKFTRVQDANGTWIYFRLWEPEWTTRMLQSLAPDQQARVFRRIDRMMVVHADGHADILHPPAQPPSQMVATWS